MVDLIFLHQINKSSLKPLKYPNIITAINKIHSKSHQVFTFFDNYSISDGSTQNDSLSVGIIQFIKQVQMSQSSYSLEQQSNSSVKRPYNRVTPEKKQELLWEVFENKMKITRAARKVELNVSTAKFLVKQYKKNHPEWTGQIKVVLPTPLSSSTEEENGPQQIVQNNYFPYYFPFFPSMSYPWTEAECNKNTLYYPYYPSY